MKMEPPSLGCTQLPCTCHTFIWSLCFLLCPPAPTEVSFYLFPFSLLHRFIASSHLHSLVRRVRAREKQTGGQVISLWGKDLWGLTRWEASLWDMLASSPHSPKPLSKGWPQCGHICKTKPWMEKPVPYHRGYTWPWEKWLSREKAQGLLQHWETSGYKAREPASCLAPQSLPLKPFGKLLPGYILVLSPPGK